jgi:hypothetical protein
MAMNGTFDGGDAAMQRRQVTGTLGIVVTLAVALILGVHPVGSTGLYDDGPRFVEHVGVLWVVIHVFGAVLLLAIPVVTAGWAETLSTPASQVFGKLTVTVSIVAVALAVLHLVGTDTMTFLAYEDTLASGVDGAEVGADVLLRVHAATLVGWVITMFVAVPLGAAAATASDHDWTWRFWLPLVTATVAVASVSVTLVARQWTTVSEMGLLRPAITLFLVWFGLTSYRLRRHAAPEAPAGVADAPFKPAGSQIVG